MKRRFLVRACLFLVKKDYFRLQCMLSTLEVLMPIFPCIRSVTIARWCPEEVFSSLTPTKPGTFKAHLFSEVQLAGPKLDV